ncbi:TetR/AcrR family transcriptional regulator [Rathayibacter sp. VKM Ac-2630]|uniref:TetR/AcrR family transcriptional regulator n=1 Tax=Rathayibacter sp. VKM Ac-2630 TaxID=1938617 RepID=UPI00098267FC|nr:TetR/AcrR family transcriptional regulator [Rathayibacter sp. VKM Ac-2630]OOB89556.1 TetR family transcriptional regulator [Rathayibacter sp. VKM Ac-2630]
MTPPFHHGNLRAELLEQAETLLRSDGVDALSLRELARRAGVSHGAPRSHFVDRQALLDALAVSGFDRLTEAARAAVESPGAFPERFRRVGRAHVAFAVEHAALMELMFRLGAGGGPVQEAAARLFQVLDGALTGGPSGDPGARERFQRLFAASVQGTAALVIAQRVTPEQGEVLIDDATAALLGSELWERVQR